MQTPAHCELLLVAVLASASAHAVEMNSDMFTLQGFGTLGLTHSSEKNADFSGSFVHPTGAGYSDEWAAAVDSKVGLQLGAQFNERWSSVIQVVSQYNYRGTYEPDVEWAYVDHAITPEFSVRIGRILTAMFMESENQMVGYTYDEVRPPNEFYGVYPLTNKDGIEARYHFSRGDTVNTIQISYGRSREKFRRVGSAIADPTWNAHYLLELGETAFRLGYVDMTLDVSSPQLDPLYAGLKQFGEMVPGAAGRQAAINYQRYRTDKTRYRIATVGARHQIANWRVQAEWATADMEVPTSFAGIRAWYTTVAYHWGHFTPYATVSSARARDTPTPTAIPTAGLPPPLAENANALNAGLEAVIPNFAFTQDSVAAGVRWDVATNMDLKLQLQRLRIGDHNYGRLTNVQPDFTPGDTINVVSATMDFVF